MIIYLVEEKQNTEDKAVEENQNLEIEHPAVIKEEPLEDGEVEDANEPEQHSASYDNSKGSIFDNDQKDDQQRDKQYQENNEASDPSNHQSESEYPKSFYSEGEEIGEELDQDIDDKDDQGT